MSAESDMNGDLKAAIQILAADNARLLGIVQAADELLEASVRALGIFVPPYTPALQSLKNAIDAYKIARNGQ